VRHAGDRESNAADDGLDQRSDHDPRRRYANARGEVTAEGVLAAGQVASATRVMAANLRRSPRG